MARTGEEGPNGISAFIVEKKYPGINFGKKEKKLGWNSQPTRAVLLEDCRVPEENLLGTLGSGFKIAMKGLDGGRINISSCSLGAAQASLEQTIEYLKIRAQFQQPLINNQGLQFKLAEMAEYISASRLFVRQAARMIDSKDLSASAYCAMSKSFVTGKCFSVIDEALQLHGGYGYLKDYRIQQYWRDARVHRILEGNLHS